MLRRVSQKLSRPAPLLGLVLLLALAVLALIGAHLDTVLN
jgi:hypothetical protein